jgi:hypothetical protein
MRRAHRRTLEVRLRGVHQHSRGETKSLLPIPWLPQPWLYWPSRHPSPRLSSGSPTAAWSPGCQSLREEEADEDVQRRQI